MSATVTPAVERITFPAGGLRLYRHQQETWDARRVLGYKRRIANDHRQSGKDVGGLVDLLDQAIHDPGVYAYIAPTRQMAENIAWHGVRATDGAAYLSILPAPLLLDRNEADLALEVATLHPGKHSRVLFLSGNEPARVRGLPLRGVVVTEYAQFEGSEILDTLLPALNRSGGDLLVLSTPLGLNHYHQLWQMAQDSPEWWTATRTIRDTVDHDGRPLIDPGLIERELAQGQRPEWLDQEYLVKFTAALASSYYGDLLTKAEADGRITDLPHRADRQVMTGWDLGIADATAILYVQEVAERLHVIDAEDYEGLSLPDILARTQRHGYIFDPRRQLAPHDIEVRDLSVGISRRDVAARLGTRFTTVPRCSVAEGIDAVRRLFPRLVFDRRKCAKLLQALGEYQKVWDAKGKVFRDAPLHSWASHYADALRTFALGYRERREPTGRPPGRAKTMTLHNMPELMGDPPRPAAPSRPFRLNNNFQ